MNNPVTRKNGLPQSEFCRMTTNGVIEIRDTPKSWPYEISVHELATFDGFVRWIDHLSQKTWCTPELLGDFVSFCSVLAFRTPDDWRTWANR